MNKIIALNWKNTQTVETAGVLIKTMEDVANIYADYSWVVFPGDNLVTAFSTKIPLGLQTVDIHSSLPYCLIGHMSQRLNGKTDEEIQGELESIIETPTTPILCVGPMKEEDTLELVIKEQLVVLEKWPKEKKLIVAYEPGFAIGTGKTMTLEDIEIVTDILREALKEFTNKSIIYGGSVNDNNIAGILRITDGVIIGTASQKSPSLLALSIALGQE
ncbi:triosephosphate isomerase [Candidatus Gracilibacteria bacterium]|nr:triosephosphate isomerase [Candidatus Gracilibacteria bacterium]